MWCWKDEAAFDDDNRIFANARFSNPIRPVPILSIHFCKLHYAKRGACWSLLLPFRPPLLTVQYSTHHVESCQTRCVTLTVSHARPQRTALASINEQSTHNFTCASRSEYSTTVVCPPFMTPFPHMFDAVDFLTWRFRRECQKTTRTRTRTSTLG